VTRLVAAWAVAALAMTAAPVGAQESAASAKAAPKAVKGPVVAPAKPAIAPRINGMGEAAIPKRPSNPKANQVSVSARQAAEKTIAALVEAMKSLPKRPPAPPEPRPGTARRATRAGAARAATVEAPAPINYHVTWPAAPEEPGVTKRVELAWPDGQSGPVSLRWNPPTPE
jgi:hypothetical protein